MKSHRFKRLSELRTFALALIASCILLNDFFQTPDSVRLLFFLAATLIAYEDIKAKSIPVDYLALLAILAILRLVLGERCVTFDEFLPSVFCAAIFLTLSLVYRGKLGMGDVILAPILCLGSSVIEILTGLFLASLSGLVVVAMLKLARKADSTWEIRLPFAPFLIAGLPLGAHLGNRVFELLTTPFF